MNLLYDIGQLLPISGPQFSICEAGALGLARDSDIYLETIPNHSRDYLSHLFDEKKSVIEDGNAVTD
jgi:hypothetical protein